MPVTSRALPGSGAANNMVEGTRYFGPVNVQAGRLSILASWTGTPTGTFFLQSSADGQTWVTVPGAAAEFTANGQAQPAGAAGSAAWTWYGVPGTQVRLGFTLTGGLGTLTAYATQGD